MKTSAQAAAAIGRRGWSVPVEATGQAARQLQRRFGIQPATEQIDATELTVLRDKADRQDRLEEALMGTDNHNTTTQEQ